MKIFYYKLQKVFFLTAFFTLFLTLVKAQTLTIGSVDVGPYTPGSSIAVPFNIGTTGGCINPDNVFKLYISSVPGGTPNIEIGSYAGFYAAFLNGTIPAALAPGNGYNLAVKSSLPAVTSNIATVNIIAGTAIMAAIDGSSINSDNPEIFGSCSSPMSSYDFVNATNGASSVTATFRDELAHSNSATYTLNPGISFTATTTTYTILVKATTTAGTISTKAYQLINNNINTNFGTSGSSTVCLSNGRGQLSFTVDYLSPNGVQYNYPGNLYIVNWGDGSSTIYTLCDIIASNGRLSHDYTESSCGINGGGEPNSYEVKAQVSSRICGPLGPTQRTSAKVVRPPTNGFTAQNSACLGDAITFNNTSDPGQDASNVNCVNVNARYAWYIDGQLIVTNRPGSTPFTYTFTTSGLHYIKLVLQSQSGSVCGADPLEKTICILAKPQPAFTVDASTICSNTKITTTDASVIDPSCANIPQNNAYTWSVTGPAATVFVDNTTSASHAPHILFPSPGVYTLTLSIGTENCGAVSTSRTITVNTTPGVALSADKTYCGKNQAFTFANNPGDTQTIFTGTFADQANTYSWTVSGGGYSYLNGTNANSKYPQIVFQDFGVYTVTATHTNNCGTESDSQQLTFLESPTINAGPDQTICPADVVQLNATTTNPQPQITPTYLWTGGTGIFSPGRNTLNPVYTPSAAEVNDGQVKLTLTSATGYPSPCNQLEDEIIITIKPRNAITSDQTKSICTGNSVDYQPTAQLAGSTFSWTSAVTSGSVTGNTASSSGKITDNLTGDGTITYTITPSKTYTSDNITCPGTTFTLKVTVTPRPTVIVNTAATTVCSGQAINIGLTPDLTGTTFKWTSIATAGISGNTNPLPSNNNVITDILFNSSTTATGSVTYTITPVGPGPTYCEGSPVTVTINVLPKPVDAYAGADKSLCAESSYTLEGNNPGISTGMWTFIPASGQNVSDVTFVNANQYNTVVNGLQPGKIYTFRWTITGAAPCNATFDNVSINNLSPLTNTISFGAPAVCYGQTITVTGQQPTGGNGTYTYSWQSSTDNINWTPINGAAGRDYSFTATVTGSIYIKRLISSSPCSSESPSIRIIVQQAITSNTISADQTICYNNLPVVLNGSTPDGGDGNFSYQWQSTVDNGANWNPISGATNINYQPTTLTVTTKFRRIVTTSLCVDDQKSTSNVVTITVNPQNTNTIISDANRTICTNASFTYQILARDANTSFTWVSSVTSGTVTGNTASGSTVNINDQLTNSDLNNNGTVTYTITPINTVNGISCPGVPFDVTVTVTPLPIITVNRTSNTICSGSGTDISFSSNLNGTQFKWTTSATAGISGNQNQLTPVGVLRIDQTLINNTTANGTVTYTITPVSASGCEGAPVTITITVQPTPLLAIAGDDEQICAATTYDLKGNNPAPFTGLWTIISTQQNVVFANPTQHNTRVSGLQPGQNYTFRWTISSAGLCAPSTDDVVISNLNSLTNNITFGAPAICFGQTATIFGDTPTGGTGSFVYRWESSIDGSTNNWTIILGQNNQNYTFTGTESVYIRRVVLSAPCSSFSDPVHIIVQPAISNNTIFADQTICYNNTPALLNGSTPAGADGNFTYQWQQSVDGGTFWTNVGSAISSYQPDALTVTTQFRRIVTSTVCSGDQKNISNNITIIVTPLNTNTITSDASRIICTGTTFRYQPTARDANTSFTWVSSATANISGNSASGSGNINDVLINSDPNNNGTVTYIITPINNNCPGVPFTLTVTVTPIPRVILTNNGQQICSGNPTGITFRTNTPGVLVRWTFDRVQGISGANDQFPVIATRIDDVLSSTRTTPGTIIYHITPISEGGCEGPTVDATVTVLPQPVTANAGADEVICSAATYTLNGNNPAPSTGKWTVNPGQSGVGFADATQYNTAVSGLQPGQTYTFVWTITSTGACATSADEVVITDLRDLTNNISFANPAICSGQTISIIGDLPTGGNGSFFYRWESSIDNSNWTTVANQTDQNYSFTGTQSIYVRRIVTSGPCTKISAPVYIIVQPPIASNTIASNQEICYNNAPSLFTGSAPTGANNDYTFQWQSSTDNGANWTNISGATAANYQAGNLTVTTIFRRVVSSVLCNGPQQSFSNTINVVVNPLVVAAYTFTKDLGCIPFVLDAQNIKAAAGPGNNTYAWYADGVLIGSGITFPGYTITKDDQQVVIKLTVTSKFGCPDASFSHTFSTIKEVSAGFSQDQTKGCGPLTVKFTNTSDPQNLATYTWDFGNGTTSASANPAAITYLPRADGKDTTYTITLRALTTCGIRTATSAVTVRPKPTSIFTPDRTVGCSPFTVNLNNTSPGTNNTYTFDFGDGQTLVTTDNQSVTHTYTTATGKSFIIKMTAANECGSSTTQYTVRISPNTVLPQLVVNGDQKAGCAPWTVQFYNNTKGGNYFTYDFGDGTTVSTLNAPEVVTHTFLKDGIYNVKLTATNGCSDTSAYQSITVYAQPKTSFTSDVQSGCKQLNVNFKNLTPGNNTYLWNFGDGSTSTVANPTHIFAGRNTPYTISLIAKNTLGCADTLSIENYINVSIPPKAAFITNPDSVIVYPYYSFSFADKSTNNPILWKWDFGDGSSASKQNPAHTYRDTGVYVVKLAVYNLQGCADTVSHKVQITGTPGQLFVPNAFMPDSKFGEITTFKIKGSGIKTWRFRIFNKWGQVIWETTKLTERGEPAEGWDGMMGGAPAPQGVYVWQVDATYINGNEWKGMSYKGSAPNRQGFIHLIR